MGENKNGTMVDGAYFNETLLGKMPGKGGLEKIQLKVTDYRMGNITVWARDRSQAMDVSDFTRDELDDYVHWHRAGLKVEADDGHVPMTYMAERPRTLLPAGNRDSERTVVVVCRDQDGLDVETYCFEVVTTLEDDRLMDAIKAASMDFLATAKGRKVWEENGHCFNYGDFLLHVTNDFCRGHRFTISRRNENTVIEVDYNTQVADPADMEKYQGTSSRHAIPSACDTGSMVFANLEDVKTHPYEPFCSVTLPVRVVDGIPLGEQTIMMSGEDIDGIMDTAISECGYWCGEVKICGDKLGQYASDQISRGGELSFETRQDGNAGSLTFNRFLAGLGKWLATLDSEMLESKLECNRINPGQIDGEDADYILQYALFGEIRYS